MSDAGWQPARARKPSIPLTLLTGPLGAGKTTLLNRLLADPAFADTAVILNEFGRTALDRGTVTESGDGIVALGAGCVCCSVRGELVEALERLLRGLDNHRIARIARVVIEASSDADPAPIFALLTRHPYLSLRFHLDGIVTVLDGATPPTAITLRQIAAADRIVLTRTDAPPPMAALRALNPGALILAAGTADATALTGIADDIPRWLAIDAVSAHQSTDAFALVRDARFTAAALETFLDEAAARFGDALIRVKGLVALAQSPDRPALVHGLGDVFALPAHLAAWPDNDRRTRLAVTAKGIDRGACTALFDAYAGTPALDTPDRAAMMDNPLSLSRYRPR